MEIIRDDPTSDEVSRLLQDHLAEMNEHSPPECVHALSPDGLDAPDITFWTARDKRRLMGCGALRQLSEDHGEIKSMKTSSQYLGRGVATAILDHIIAEARSRGYSRLSLETGSGAAFEPAQALYIKSGFEYCGPFGDYPENPFSRFMTRQI